MSKVPLIRQETIYVNVDAGVTITKGVIQGPGLSVAIKEEMYPDLGQANAAIRESLSMMKIAHPAVCKVYDCALTQDQGMFKSTIVVELLESDLNKQITMRTANRLHYTEDQLLQYLSTLVSALSYAQKQEVSHRDIKPQNIFCSADGSVVKLGDFGSATREFFGGFMKSSIVGSPFFLSPQLKMMFAQSMNGYSSGTYNPFKSDVYSLGVVFLYLARLQAPIELMKLDQLQQITSNLLGEIQGYPTLCKVLPRMLEINEPDRCDFLELEQIVARDTGLVPTVPGDGTQRSQLSMYRTVPSQYGAGQEAFQQPTGHFHAAAASYSGPPRQDADGQYRPLLDNYGQGLLGGGYVNVPASGLSAMEGNQGRGQAAPLPSFQQQPQPAYPPVPVPQPAMQASPQYTPPGNFQYPNAPDAQYRPPGSYQYPAVVNSPQHTPVGPPSYPPMQGISVCQKCGRSFSNPNQREQFCSIACRPYPSHPYAPNFKKCAMCDYGARPLTAIPPDLNKYLAFAGSVCSVDCLRKFEQMAGVKWGCAYCHIRMEEQTGFKAPCGHYFHSKDCFFTFVLDTTTNFTQWRQMRCPKCQVSIPFDGARVIFGWEEFDERRRGVEMISCCVCGEYGAQCPTKCSHNVCGRGDSNHCQSYCKYCSQQPFQ